MTYIEASNGGVILQMTWDNWATLLMLLGFATGAAQTEEKRRWVLAFVNELNRTNPRFTPYQL